MLPKNIAKLLYFLIAVTLSSACGLIPNFSKETMSNADKAVLYMQMGIRYLEMDKLEIAKDKLDTAMRLDSSNADIYNVMAGFYERIREYSLAEDYFQTAVGKAPNSFDIKNNYGRFLCERGDYKKGMALLQEALDQPMNTRQWFALTNMGVCYVKQNDLQHGEEYLRHALAIAAGISPGFAANAKNQL